MDFDDSLMKLVRDFMGSLVVGMGLVLGLMILNEVMFAKNLLFFGVVLLF